MLKKSLKLNIKGMKVKKKLRWVMLCLMVLSSMLNASLFEKYSKACKSADAEGCFAMGYYYEEGVSGVMQSYLKAKKYYEKACKKNFGSACDHLGQMYYKGTGVRQNYNKAKELYLKTCKDGEVFGCYHAAEMYIRGEGGEKDFLRANELATKACGDGKIWKKTEYGDSLMSGKSQSCMMLGLIYEIGIGVDKNITKAKEYYGNICDQGEEEGCREYARINTEK